tara:strand:- start:4118 stop:5209 length:1092 start_codon:yes stop_codon:yes gene_type:complete
MTTLADNEIYTYLDHLKNELSRSKDLASQSMQDILDAEERFLKYANSNGTTAMLSISPNGLPSAESLIPDLEKMAELGNDDDEFDFKEIAERLKRGIVEPNTKDGEIYFSRVNENRWNQRLQEYDRTKIDIKIGISIQETSSDKLQLTVREDVYLKGYDKHCLECPVLSKQVVAHFHIVWNNLVSQKRYYFYEASEKGSITQTAQSSFDDILKRYYFTRKHFQATRVSGYMWGLKRVFPKTTRELLDCSHASRSIFTRCLLAKLGQVFNREVSIKDFNMQELDEELRFSTVTGNSASSLEKQLIDDDEKVLGTISYDHPNMENKKLHLGGIVLTIHGKAIEDEFQYVALYKGLKKFSCSNKTE